MNRPIIGISMGDPFGNGPDILIHSLRQGLPQTCHLLRHWMQNCRRPGAGRSRNAGPLRTAARSCPRKSGI